MKRILAINPGSTSTKVSVFDDRKLLETTNISHSTESLKAFATVAEQFDFRKDAILNWLQEVKIPLDSLSAIVGRGGLLRPMPGGTYPVTARMAQDLQEGKRGEHASNLGGLIARSLADELGVEAYIVDPVAVDEFPDIARISGLKEIECQSMVHALNVRAIAQRHAESIGKELSAINLIVAHLGGGISVVAMEKGRMIELNNANEMGPFSPERTGGLPVGDLAKLIFDGRFEDFSACKRFLRGEGGMVAYLGESDLREVEKRIDQGDDFARQVVEAMSYQIAKEIGSLGPVLKGEVEAILLTGGIAHNPRVTGFIEDRVSFIAPVHVYPGEDEMEALALGALRVLEGRANARNYDKEAKFDETF